MNWHADDAVLERYAAGTLDDATAFSLEAHLLTCESCRARTAPFVDTPRLESVWAGVLELVDTPRVTPIERVLLRFGMPEHLARLLAATPSLTLSWLSAVALCLTFAVVAAYESDQAVGAFLVLAPLLPLAGVAAAYGPWLDPVYEIALAAPLRTFRLLLLRTAVVVSGTMVLTAVAALALPNLEWRVAAWLLPALGLVLASLALATYVSPGWAFGGAAALWVGSVLLVRAGSGDTDAAFAAPVQAAFAVAAVLAAAVLARRPHSLESGRET